MRKALKIVFIGFGIMIGIPALLGIGIGIFGFLGNLSKPDWDELAKMEDADSFKGAIAELKKDAEITTPRNFYNCGDSCEGDTFFITLPMERESRSKVSKREPLTDQDGKTDISFQALNISWEKNGDELVGTVFLPSGNLKINDDVLKFSKLSLLGTYVEADGMVGNAKAKGIVTGFEVVNQKKLTEVLERKRIAKKKKQEWLAFKSKTLKTFEEGYEYSHWLPSMGSCTPRHSKDKCINNETWINACRLVVGDGDKSRSLTRADKNQMRSALLAMPYSSGMKRTIRNSIIKTYGAKTFGIDNGFTPPRCVIAGVLSHRIGKTELTKNIRGVVVSFKRVGNKLSTSCSFVNVAEWIGRMRDDNRGRDMRMSTILPKVCAAQNKK